MHSGDRRPLMCAVHVDSEIDRQTTSYNSCEPNYWSPSFQRILQAPAPKPIHTQTVYPLLVDRLQPITYDEWRAHLLQHGTAGAPLRRGGAPGSAMCSFCLHRGEGVTRRCLDLWPLALRHAAACQRALDAVGVLLSGACQDTPRARQRPHVVHRLP